MKVYLGNLSSDTTDAQLGELVASFGKAESAQVVKDRATGEARGFGFVVFENDDHARAAIAGLNGKEVGGRVLKVNEARPKNAK